MGWSAHRRRRELAEEATRNEFSITEPLINFNQMTDEELRKLADERGIPATVTRRETLIQRLSQ